MPVCQQLVAMKFDPCLNQSSLSQWQVAADKLACVNEKCSSFTLIDGMEMRQVMAFATFNIHPNGKPVEPRYFRHILPCWLHNTLPRHVVTHDGKAAAAVREEVAQPVDHREQQRRHQRVVLRQQL